MPRQLQGAEALMDQMTTIAPINKGGTGASTAEQAIVNLGGVSRDRIGQLGGIAQADTNGHIPISILQEIGLSVGYSITGPEQVVIGQTAFFHISNYNMLNPVEISTDVGSCELIGDVIHVTPPASGTELTLTIGARTLVLPIIEAGIKKPVILFPPGDATPISPGVTFYTSGFIAGPEQYSEWFEITDTEYTIAFPVNTTSIICEGRRGETGEATVTIGSNVYGFGVSLTQRELPRNAEGSLVITRSGSGYVRYRWVFLSATHQSSSWDIATDPEFTNLVHTSHDTVNLTSMAMPELDMSSIFYLRVRYTTQELGSTQWSDTVSFMTTEGSYPRIELMKLSASDAVAGDEFGNVVDVNDTGDQFVIGSFQADIESSVNSGVVYTYQRIDNSFYRTAKLVSGSAATRVDITETSDGSVRIQTNSPIPLDQIYTSSTSVDIPEGATSITITGKGGSEVITTNPGQPYIAPTGSPGSANTTYYTDNTNHGVSGGDFNFSTPSFPGGMSEAHIYAAIDPIANEWMASMNNTAGIRTIQGSARAQIRVNIPGYTDEMPLALPSSPWLVFSDLDGQKITGPVTLRARTYSLGHVTYTFSVIKVVYPSGPSADYNPGQPYIAPYQQTSTGSTTSVRINGTTQSYEGGYGGRTPVSRTDTIFINAGHSFGSSAAISGDGLYLISGAPDAAHNDNTHQGLVGISAKIGDVWQAPIYLTASDGVANNVFGYNVDIDGDGNTAVVSARGFSSNKGKVYVFTRSEAIWTHQTTLFSNDGRSADYFGSSVALSSDGNTVLIGSPGDDDKGSYSGSVYIFIRTGAVWTQEAKLLASDGAAGDNFGDGGCLSSDGNIALIGAYGDDDAGSMSGSVYVFKRSGGVWSQQVKLTASDGVAGQQFGYSVSVNDAGTIAAIGANLANSGQGVVYIFTQTNGVWTQQAKLTASDAAASAYFGNSVSLSASGRTAYIGAKGDASNRGAVYVFQ